ncbi:hypothetical protein UFOVP411_29 [uncultured Caudovirales phage]|uniref:Uncharacterized protein n=1 Tax=uncultured Caudovirales phage TaxID=2100421 RepID=A0A6J5M7D7_9CAUD|nr:hypothetical protein UFOVP411_29 [uncultured Caudovirales phage]
MLYRTLESCRLETLAFLGDGAAAVELARRLADAPQELKELEGRAEAAEAEASSLEDDVHSLRYRLATVVDTLRELLDDTEGSTDPEDLRGAVRRYIQRLEA